MSVEVVGREAELEAIADLLDGLNGHPAALLLGGEAGIGKTTLWLSGLEQARHLGFRVLLARPVAAEAQLAHASLADLLRQVEERIRQELPEPQRRALDVVMLRIADGSPTDQRATGAALLSILVALAEDAPVLLALDDLQWVDRSSLHAIAFALRRLASPVALLATVRTKLGAPSPQSIELPTPGAVRHLRVGPLPSDTLRRLIGNHAGRPLPAPAMARIEKVSGGNPFYALELARAARATGATTSHVPLPTTLADLVSSRLRALSSARVQEALLVMAALADPTVGLVELAIRADAVEIGSVVEEAERAGIVSVEGQRLRFTHPLLAAGVYASASPGDRRAVHRQLAGIVGDTEEHARHLALATMRGDEHTLTALDDAALQAESRGAPTAAAELLELAIRLGGGTPERRIRLAQHQFDAGDPLEARSVLEALIETTGPGLLRAEALRQLGMVRLHDDDYRQSAACLEQALREAGQDLHLRVLILIALLFVLVNLGRIPDAKALTNEALAESERLADEELLATALACTTMIRFLSGDGLDEVDIQRAVDLENVELALPVMFRPSLIHSLLLAWTGRLDQAREGLLGVRRRCIERGQESDLMFSAFHTVVIECWRGNFADARLLAEDTLDRALQLGTDLPLAIALSTQANVAAYAGLADETRRAATQALAIFQRGGCLAVTVWPMVTLGFLEVSIGNYQAAIDVLGPLAAAASAMGYGEPTAAPFAPDAAEALVGLGRLDEAAVLIEQLERNGQRLDRPWALALGGRCRSMLLAAQGDLDGAAKAAADAMREHDRLPMPFERARTELVMGQIHRRQRRKQAAAEALADAARVFDELDTPLWAARARAELQRVNVKLAGPAELTASERRVAEMAATGMTNREAAAALFISPKMIEANLVRVYRKLGIRSRAELGQRMAEPKT